MNYKFKNATTIQISKKNHEYLLKIGAKGDTFDEIITRILREEKRENENFGGAK
jgi:predicted CopG family antitoxin